MAWQKNKNECTDRGPKIVGVRFLSESEMLALRIRARDFKLFIGIDPGVNTGLAVWCKVFKELWNVDTMPIHKAMEIVRRQTQHFDREDILVRVEDARLRQYLPKEKDNATYRGKLMGAGSIKRDCTIWEDFLTDEGFPFEMLAPKPGATKWSSDYFTKVTSWKKPTNNHGRDAALIVFGL